MDSVKVSPKDFCTVGISLCKLTVDFATLFCVDWKSANALLYATNPVIGILMSNPYYLPISKAFVYMALIVSIAVVFAS